MAIVGAVLSALLMVLLAAGRAIPRLAEWYVPLHRALFVIFFIYAAAGIALCAVGIYDRKRSAIWAMLAVLAMTLAAAIDTVIYFGLASGPPAVPWGFVAFWMLLAIGYARRYADRPLPPDLREAARIAANNQTRRSRSISRKLLREGRLHLLPAFHLVNLSGLGHEGIVNSGSYEFADHIYRSVPSGRTRLGKWVDAIILAMPATRAFRLRYKKAQEEIRTALNSFARDPSIPNDQPLRVLAIPCGLPRDLTELAATLAKQDPALLSRIAYVGMDVDPELLKKAKAFAANCGVPSMTFHQGNALLRDEYPPGEFHAIVSTGLGEFLDDAQLESLYGNVFDVLAPGGTFYTSATREEARSELMLRAFELNTHYRSSLRLQQILRRWPWRRLMIAQDDSGLQSFVVAVK
jgi:SAM-dependent methyltransferase